MKNGLGGLWAICKGTGTKELRKITKILILREQSRK